MTWPIAGACAAPFEDEVEAARLIRDAALGHGAPSLVRRIDALREDLRRAGMPKAHLALAVRGRDALPWAERRLAQAMARAMTAPPADPEATGLLLSAQALVGAVRAVQHLDEQVLRA